MKKVCKVFVTFISSVLFVGIWEILSITIDADVILPSPFAVLKALWSVVSQKPFFLDVFSTVLRALLSFVIITVSGFVLGLLAGHFPIVNYALKPLLAVLKATPVMSVILLAFIWFDTGTVPVFSAFLMAFPIMFIQVFESYNQCDGKLNEMCRVYGIKGFAKFRHFVFPSILPGLVSGAKQSLSLIWKVAIASEVLTIPANGIGRRLQLAQIYLETDRVFAWTVVAILLTVIGDFIFKSISKKMMKRRSFNED